MSGYVEVSSKQSLVEKYLEFKQLMLRIDPAEEDEEEKLASTMRAYQVLESPHITPSAVGGDGNVVMGGPTAPPMMVPPLQLFGANAPGMMSFSSMSTPMKSSSSRPKGSRTPRSPRGDKSSSGKKSKSHKKRKRKMDSDESDDDSDCDPDFRAWTQPKN